jgi:hypothetical protein
MNMISFDEKSTIIFNMLNPIGINNFFKRGPRTKHLISFETTESARILPPE